MIQRKQSLFLIAAIILEIILFFYPYLEILTSDGTITLFFDGLYRDGIFVQPLLLSYVLIIMIPLLTLIALFLFKKRVLQMRITLLSAILDIALFGVFLFYYYLLKDEAELVIFQLISVFPLLAGVFKFFAFRGIRKDEALVRSLDRIR